MSERNYYSEALNIVWGNQHWDTALDLLRDAQDEISILRAELATATLTTLTTLTGTRMRRSGECCDCGHSWWE